MTDFPIPDAVLANHAAFLGKTGSGKTSTEKLVVERVVEAGYRVCVLDTIKSDWWGITSSADGQSPGLPFRILGGPRGHVPLHASSGAVIGQLVAEGKLPFSIVDMADFEPGGVQRFFVDFAQALMRHMRGVLYLVIEEAHEIAPKERAGFGAENMAIHMAKKLATAGRSKGIRLIVATQRVQSLHNAVLGSCETIVAHRLTTPADQKPVVDWLKANTNKATAEQVSASLSGLPTGTAWLCSGEAQIFAQVAFPKFATFDNTATPTAESVEFEVTTAPVDHDELVSLIGVAAAEAEANDPKALKAEVARLTASLEGSGKAPQNIRENIPDPRVAELEAEVARVTENAATWHKRYAGAIELLRTIGREVGQRVAGADRFIQEHVEGLPEDRVSITAQSDRNSEPVVATAAPDRERQPGGSVTAGAAKGVTAGETALTARHDRILNALAWWRAFGIDAPTTDQVGFVAGYAPASGNFKNLRGQLNVAGLVDYPSPGRVRLTEAGVRRAQKPAIAPTREGFHEAVRAKLQDRQLRLFDPILAAYPASLTTEQLAKAADYAPDSGNFKNLRGSLRTPGLIDYPEPGHVRAADWLFP